MSLKHRGISTVSVIGLIALILSCYVGWQLYERAQVKAEKQRVHDTAQAARQEFTRLQAQWKDSLELASSTPRIGLAGPLQRLQALRQETQAVAVPPCLQSGKDHLVAGMNSAIDGLMAFMRNNLDKFELNDLTTEKMGAMQTHFISYGETATACPAP